MTADQWVQVQRFFDQAVDMSVAVRSAWLDDHCADPVVRREVGVMLSASDKAGTFLEIPFETLAAGLVADESDLPRLIGTYRVLREIGRCSKPS